MAKKRKKGSSFGLGILDGLIDLAGGAAMNAVANHMERKYHYSAKGKINPYRVSAIGVASGRMKTTRDIMRAGAFLGAKGSFNVTTDPPGSDPHENELYEDYFFVSEDPLLNAIADTVENDNRYAWRLNCEDGSEYGIYPEAYETREEYNLALDEARTYDDQYVNDPEVSISNDSIHPLKNQNETMEAYCLVSRLDNGKTEGHWISQRHINVGDIVEISVEAGVVRGVVISIKDKETYN